MTFKYNNVYIENTTTIAGPYEKSGPIGNYFDKCYDDLYFGTNTWEDAESYILEESVNMLLKKVNKNNKEINLFISGDLLNQTVSSNYAAKNLNIPFMGIYNACATSVLGLIIGSNMVEKQQIDNCICSSSSHNNGAEKQFRYPVEYGGPKPKTTTFTVTGAASSYLSRNKALIKVESSTVGTVCDMGVTDVYHMGAVMAPACACTINAHLKDLGRSIDYYDFVYSGDLGKYGKKILKEYLKKEYDIKLQNYDDTACMILNDKECFYAGGSGPACAPLVTFSYIFEQMKKKKLKKVLLLATGALMSSSMVNEKHTIPSIAHAISLEVCDDLL